MFGKECLSRLEKEMAERHFALFLKIRIQAIQVVVGWSKKPSIPEDAAQDEVAGGDAGRAAAPPALPAPPLLSGGTTSGCQGTSEE